MDDPLIGRLTLHRRGGLWRYRWRWRGYTHEAGGYQTKDAAIEAFADFMRRTWGQHAGI